MMALVLLVSAMPALAGGPDKVEVCHLNDDGGLHVISRADPASDAHVAHGDQQIGIDVDENCQPLDATPQSGCIPFEVITGKANYFQFDGSVVQDASGGLVYFDDGCATPVTAFPDGLYFIWAATLSQADTLCTGVGGTFVAASTLTPDLYLCAVL